MKELRTEIEIDASPGHVWEVLIDFPRYGEWNPFIKRIEGQPREGTVLEVDLQQTEGGKPMVIRPVVIDCDRGVEFAWRGRLWVPKIFDGEHHFTLESLEGDRTRFHHWERFGGILVPLLSSMLEDKTKPAFERMNRALKDRVEAVARAER
jgi:hypothetical protein